MRNYSRVMTSENLYKLVGKKIIRIFINEDYLKFETDGGPFVFRVEGDCCSRSVFYDLIGTKKLLENGPVLAVKELELGDGEEKDDRKKDYHDSAISLYGYAITTEHPEFGEQTSVFSFRNYSNGYYGGWMEAASDREVFPEVTDDVLETVPVPSK
jgi:hypothetical protein